MDTINIVLYVFDTLENFNKSKSFLGTEGSAFKKMIQILDANHFEREFALLGDDEYAFMVVHAFYTNSISGLKSFAASRLEKKYANLGFMYISEGDGKEINKQLIDADLEPTTVYKYHQVQSILEEEKLKVYKKKEILQLAASDRQIESPNAIKPLYNTIVPQCDYVIITALEDDEMEKVLPMITKTGTVSNKMHLIEFGHLKDKPSKTIAYASQLATGMVDASILATEMLLLFRPKVLIMAGVLGGKPGDVNIGDVVIATKVFTIDKGKVSELGFKRDLESTNTDGSYITAIKRKKADIIEFIRAGDGTRKQTVDIHFGSIGCVRQVIDLKDYFEEEISSVDRKAIALEMESYGISRACELVNNGATTTLIIKSAMDNTVDKVDDAKTYAAWTSAKVVQFIFEYDII
jgi:nucleoside phosphorylase